MGTTAAIPQTRRVRHQISLKHQLLAWHETIDNCSLSLLFVPHFYHQGWAEVPVELYEPRGKITWLILGTVYLIYRWRGAALSWLTSGSKLFWDWEKS